jgi:hypothetical protein
MHRVFTRSIKNFSKNKFTEGQIIIFTLILNPEPNTYPDLILFFNPDPAPLKQIISDLNGSESQCD